MNTFKVIKNYFCTHKYKKVTRKSEYMYMRNKYNFADRNEIFVEAVGTNQKSDFNKIEEFMVCKKCGKEKPFNS